MTDRATGRDAARSAGSRLTLLVLCFGGVTVSLTQTIIMPLQGEFPRLLSTSVEGAGWVMTITLLTGAVAMPVSGRLADMFGKRRLLVALTAFLGVGSLICALSDSLLPMLCGRGLQGLAMGFIPVGMTLLRDVMPPGRSAVAVGVMSATLGFGGALALPLSAWVADTYSWQLLFWLSTALAVLLGAALALAVPTGASPAGGRIDLWGAAGLAAGLSALLLGISRGSEWGWLDTWTFGTIALGVVVLGVWSAFELRCDEPLVDLRSTARGPVLITNLAALAIGFGLMMHVLAGPQLLQLPQSTGIGMGLSLTEAGLVMMPGSLAMMVCAPFSGLLINRLGAKFTLALGACGLASGHLIGFLWMSEPWHLVLSGCIAFGGVGIGFAAMPTLVMNAVPHRVVGGAVGLNSLMKSVGSTFAAAAGATILARSAGASLTPSAEAFQTCFLLGAVLAILGAALVQLLPSDRPSRHGGHVPLDSVVEGHPSGSLSLP